MKTPRFSFLAILALTVAGTLPARAAGSIRVTISPNVLLADGISTATVSAEVRSSSGRPARDGTEVRFYTTAGQITQVSFTSAGVARATLTAAAVPQAANISVSAGIDQAVVTIPMVSKLVETNVGGRVLKITGKYVAFSEDKRFIQADGQVKVVFRGLEVEANSVQLDINDNTLKALGKVHLSSDDKNLVGDRAWIDLKTFEGYILAVGFKQWFSAYGLTELPEKPKKLNPDFELVDLTDSKLLWVSKQANYTMDERVQVQGARAFVAGLKSIRMPFHQVDLDRGFGDSGQYIGIGTEGLSLDLPLYVRMTPNASTAFNIGYGSRGGGIGYFTRDKGLHIDMIQKYGLAGASEGEARITDIASPSRLGFQWSHTQQIAKTTRLVSNLQFPEHRDMYGQLNLTSGLPIGNLSLAMSGAKTRRASGLAKTFQFAFETKPKPIASGKVNASVETTFFRRDQQSVRTSFGFGSERSRRRTFDLPGTQYQTVGLKLRPRPAQLMKGLTLDSSASLRTVMGGFNSGFGPAFETQLRKTLPRNGYLSFGINYNHLASINDFAPVQGKINTNLNVSYPVTSKFRITALGTMALDAESRNSLLQLSYQISESWRFDVLHSLFRFGGFGDSDYQFGISRAIGGRELGLYWSRREHKFIVEFGAARF